MLNSRFYLELYQPESVDELKTFHEMIFKTLHDFSEPCTDGLSKAKYRSWIGVSYPLFGKLGQYASPVPDDANYALNFAIKHPGLFLGKVVHLVSAQRCYLERLLESDLLSWLDGIQAVHSDILLVPENCIEVIFIRDRRPERRTVRYRMKNTKLSRTDLGKMPHQPTTLTEPLPRVTAIGADERRKPIHVGKVDKVNRIDGYFSMYGLSKQKASVPLLLPQNTFF